MTPEAIEDVLAFLRNEPTTSVRAANKRFVENDENDEENTPVKLLPSRTTTQRILKVIHKREINSIFPFKEHKFHPYKMQHHQELKPLDHAVRVEHAINQLGLIGASPDYLQNLLFSDEAHFEIHGNVNHQNFR